MGLLEYVPNELTSELCGILTSEHFRQLIISHDLISSQIYQSPTLRLYPSGIQLTTSGARELNIKV